MVRKSPTPNLRRKSLIIMDNAKYHKTRVGARLLKKTISKMVKKDYQDYLTGNSIPWTMNDKRKELAIKVREHFNNLRIEVEVMAEKFGHEFLWIPPYHFELNPIENMWGISKNHVAAQFSLTSRGKKDILKRLYEGFDKCTPDVWRKAINKARRFHKTYE